MEENKVYCSNCGDLIENDDYDTVNGEPICQDCAERYTVICDICGATIWESDAYGDDYTNLCHHCYENHYIRCCNCDALVHEDDVYHLDGYSYCRECYDEERNKCCNIHDYGYKPEPIFYGDSDRYFGIELEIDGAGKDDDYAEELLEIGNRSDEHIYIKSDGSLDDGMEIVSHPMTLEFHKDFCWEEIMRKAISLGYRSHQTSTCGLHIHVNRNCLGEDRDDQETVISKILYFTERHWNELLKFSRRSEYSMNRWAARYGYENSPKAILEKANWLGLYSKHPTLKFISRFRIGSLLQFFLNSEGVSIRQIAFVEPSKEVSVDKLKNRRVRNESRFMGRFLQTVRKDCHFAY